MSSGHDGERLRREASAVIGALWSTGALWVGLSAGPVGGFGPLPHPELVWPTVAFAVAVGASLLMASRRSGAPMPVLHAAVAAGSVAVSVVVVGGGEGPSAAWGSLFGYVAAASFFYFPLRAAVLHFLFAAGGYALALGAVEAGGAAQWLSVMGTAAGGAGLLGWLGNRMQSLWAADRAEASALAELEATRQSFLQAVSHELRTPLTTVRGFAATLRDHGDRLSPEQITDVYQRLCTSSERLDGLLSDLLDVDRLSRTETTARRELVDVRSLLQHSVDVVDSGPLQIVVEASSWPVAVEPAKVERIVVNLVSNAAKHAVGATRVIVRALPDGRGGLVLEIFDNGAGMPRGEERQDLLRPFHQGPAAQRHPNPGTGLGLAIVERFAAMHGGTVTLGDARSGGALVRVTLPAPSDGVAVADHAARWVSGRVESLEDGAGEVVHRVGHHDRAAGEFGTVVA